MPTRPPVPVEFKETGRLGRPCRRCKKPQPCQLVRVEKGQVIEVDRMPFDVEVRVTLERCARCRSFFLPEGVR